MYTLWTLYTYTCIHYGLWCIQHPVWCSIRCGSIQHLHDAYICIRYIWYPLNPKETVFCKRDPSAYTCKCRYVYDSCGILWINRLFCRIPSLLDSMDTTWIIYISAFTCICGWVSFAEYRLFYRALLQKRPIILTRVYMRILQTSYTYTHIHIFIYTYTLILRLIRMGHMCNVCHHTYAHRSIFTYTYIFIYIYIHIYIYVYIYIYIYIYICT